MKTKPSKNIKAESSANETQTVAPATPIPDPSALAEAAKKEERVIAARDYLHVIEILRDEKRFSFRRIAAWLNERGLPLDNNDVYRAYVGSIPGEEKMAMKATGFEIDPED
jgi:hypothetical protein